MLNLAAACLYLAVVAAGIAAARVAGKRDEAWTPDRRFWWLLAGFFALLAAMRLAGTEDFVRGAMRRVLHAEGAYAERRRVQAMVVMGVAAVALMASGYLAMRARPAAPIAARRARAMRLARVGVAALVGLVVLRLISLHAIDRLLYRPPHLNWLIDVGATLLTAGAALGYVRAAPSRRGSRSRSGPR